jgi:DNA-binding transcriptional ArsR family regulator
MPDDPEVTSTPPGPPERPESGLEPRKVTDAKELRALAHPLRLRLLEELVVNDPATDTATATELAERVGESPANCSWHLRQLAKYGYIEEAPGGVGRERRWRAVLEMRDLDSTDQDIKYSMAADAVYNMLINHEVQQLRQSTAWRSSEPSEWRDAYGSTTGIAWCTAAELRAINDEIFQLLGRYFSRLTDPSSRPDGARLVRFVSWGIPARPYVRDTSDTDARPSDTKENDDA